MQKLWRDRLSGQELDFVTLLARVDCLSRQTRYRDIAQTVKYALDEGLKDSSDNFDEKATELLRLHQSYANIFTKGALRYAIERAKATPAWLYPVKTSNDKEFEVRTHGAAVFICLW